MTELTPVRRRALRAQAHHLHPVVSIAGNGLSASVVAEIERNLNAHGLIKVRVYGEERSERAILMERICAQTTSVPVQHIGNILVLWREKPEDAPPKTVAQKPAPRAAQATPKRPAAPRARQSRPGNRSTSGGPARRSAGNLARRG
ncbi:MAG: YhbY family RNA-binding protein [Rhodocyclaceae bacterium]|nr:YhbY family RNA-binding protein [Rhodocyclaceae bacterium]